MVAPHPNQDSASIPQVSFNPAPFLNQSAWHVSYATGNNNNDGLTQATALADAFEIRRRWNGGVSGVRPQLPAIKITVTVHDGTAGFTDPILPALCDVDISAGTYLLIQGTDTVAHSGTVSTVPNAFARTPTGQQTITDAGVGDWTPFDNKLLVDTTSSAVAWVVGGVSPATISASRHAVDTTSIATLPIAAGLTAAAIAAGNNYEVHTQTSVYLGTGANVRMLDGGANLGVIAIERLHGTSQGGLDTVTMDTDGEFVFGQTGSCLLFSECQLDQILSYGAGVFFCNCQSFALVGRPTATASSNVLCGYTRANVSFGTNQTFDQDFALLAHLIYEPLPDCAIAFFGNVARYNTGGALVALQMSAGHFPGRVQVGPVFDGQGTFYGSNGGGDIVHMHGGGALYVQATATAGLVFDGTTFAIGNSASAFGFNTGTGAIVGPTTLTVAHLDAALAAGTGFGSIAWSPSTGDRICVNGTG